MMVDDNLILSFEVKPLGSRGRVVRLGSVVDEIISKHDYPAPVSNLLAEAVALVAMLGSALKFDGKLILQTRTNGPVSMIVADYSTPGDIRGYAHFDREKVEAVGTDADAAALLGSGHLALTIDQGEEMDNYQGIVALDGCMLGEAAHGYFQQSEQIPTSLKIAAGQLANDSGSKWRAGAIMVQHMPASGPASPMHFASGDAPEGYGEVVREDDDWAKARLLLETTEDHELLDPMLAPERLLYRLYHEDGVTAYTPSRLAHKCTCSKERVLTTLASFSEQDRRDMVVDGQIEVTCQFCSNVHRFDAKELT